MKYASQWMRQRKKWSCIKLCVLCFVLAVIWYKLTVMFMDDGRSKLSRDYVIGDYLADDVPEAKTPKHGAHVGNPNIVNIFTETVDGSDKAAGTFEVTQLHTLKGKTPIYIHPPDIDVMISAHVHDYGTWEENFLEQTATMLLRHPGITFIDVGCNIGVYTLYMADLGVDVIAIDPVVENLRLLSKSVHAGHFRGNVNLVWNAISNEYKEVVMNVPKDNIGGAHVMDDTGEARAGDDVRDEMHEFTYVETILMDDLIPMVKDGGGTVAIKMDIEGHEANALKGAKDLFQTLDVRFVFMEWVHHRHTANGQWIVEFLVRNGLFPYDDVNMKKFLDPDRFYTWPENVFWIKR